MQFEPKSREALAESNLIPKGTYDCECVKAEETRSKKGNDMLVLNLKVWMEDGSTRYTTDYIVPNTDMGLTKLLSWCDATGLFEQYQAGDLDAGMCHGKACLVSMVQQKDKQSGELRNNVREYKLPGAELPKQAAPKQPETEADPDGDDIPF